MSGRQTKRDRRRSSLERMRDEWVDHDFRIRLETYGTGRSRLTWSIDSDPAVALIGVQRVRDLLTAVEEELVLELRSQGESWDDIGLLLDRTGEAARRRFKGVDAS